MPSRASFQVFMRRTHPLSQPGAIKAPSLHKWLVLQDIQENRLVTVLSSKRRSGNSQRLYRLFAGLQQLIAEQQDSASGLYGSVSMRRTSWIS